MRSALKDVRPECLPSSAERPVSEGYAFYALHPETYAIAAERFAAAARPHSVECVGIRSIGTSLSAVVAAALLRQNIAVRCWTVRPRGHPFDRELRLRRDLQHELRARAATAHYLIVDEGPGLSGTSFGSTARALLELGIAADRIAFFPSWNSDGSTFRSDAARAAWRTHARWTVTAAEAGTGIEAATGRERWVELSGGAWRQTLITDRGRWPAVQPQHERLKRLVPATGECVRFAGLGRYGEECRRRAVLLAEAGFGPAPGSLHNGYLRLPFVEGTPCERQPDADVRMFVPGYLAALRRDFPTHRAPGLTVLHHMIETNCREADSTLRVPPLASFGTALADVPATALDGRMLAHEFVRTAAGIVKTDALEHCRDHFFPGTQDIAWDLAASEAELRLDAHASALLLDMFGAASGDRDIAHRMAFYRLAYAAYQLGYASYACAALGGTPDGQRFAARRTEFLERVTLLLAR